MDTRQGVSLIEVMIVFAILSLLILPGVMVIREYSRGENDIGFRYEVLQKLEERIESALAMQFSDISEGVSSDVVIESSNGVKLDLKSANISSKKVFFECICEAMPVEFAIIKNVEMRQLQRVSLEKGMKKITVSAFWREGNEARKLFLTVYKANL